MSILAFVEEAYRGDPAITLFRVLRPELRSVPLIEVDVDRTKKQQVSAIARDLESAIEENLRWQTGRIQYEILATKEDGAIRRSYPVVREGQAPPVKGSGEDAAAVHAAALASLVSQMGTVVATVGQFTTMNRAMVEANFGDARRNLKDAQKQNRQLSRTVVKLRKGTDDMFDRAMLYRGASAGILPAGGGEDGENPTTIEAFREKLAALTQTVGPALQFVGPAIAAWIQATQHRSGYGSESAPRGAKEDGTKSEAMAEFRACLAAISDGEILAILATLVAMKGGKTILRCLIDPLPAAKQTRVLSAVDGVFQRAQEVPADAHEERQDVSADS